MPILRASPREPLPIMPRENAEAPIAPRLLVCPLAVAEVKRRRHEGGRLPYRTGAVSVARCADSASRARLLWRVPAVGGTAFALLARRCFELHDDEVVVRHGEARGDGGKAHRGRA